MVGARRLRAEATAPPWPRCAPAQFFRVAIVTPDMVSAPERQRDRDGVDAADDQRRMLEIRRGCSLFL